MAPNYFTFLATALLAAVLFDGTKIRAEAPPAPEHLQRVRELIEDGIRRERAPSVAVAVIQEGKIIWAKGFGLGVVEEKKPATPDSIYLLASVSKPMAATGLMALVDRGLIDLDQPVNAYLPGTKLRAYRGSAEEITLRRLANHTSGMPIHYNFFYNGIAPPDRDETIREYGFAYTPPGNRWEYCNLGYGIIDYLISLTANQPWGEFMEANVYDPAGMRHTSDRVRPGLEQLATAQYVSDSAGRFVRIHSYRFDHDAASANWSSANDLARFLLLHLNDGAIEGAKVLSKESARAMREVTGIRWPDRPGQGSGVGWFIEEIQGYLAFGHSGGMPGVSTRIRAFPEFKSGFVVLINASAGGFLEEISRGLGQALLPKEPTFKNSGSKPADKTEPAKKPEEKQEENFSGNWKGILAHGDGKIEMRLEIASAAKVQLGKGTPIPLNSLSINGQGLTGQIQGRLKTQPSYHGPVTLEFRLEKNGEELTGVCVAMVPDYFALSHWVELQKETATSENLE